MMDALQVKVIYWQRKWKIPKTQWTICGFSRSAYRTGFYISDLDLMLDAGPQNFNKPSNILITHTHIDHIACLPFTMIGDSNGNHIFNITAHADAQPYIHNYIKAMFSVNEMREVNECGDWYKYHGVQPFDVFRRTMNKQDFEIAVFKCDHAIPTVSYGISEIKQKLKEEYSKLPGKDIAVLRKQGVQITQEVVTKKLAYVCDTSIAAIDMNPSILDYEVVFIECTFFMPDELENAVKTQHIHWDHLKKYVVEYPNTNFMLFHFSQRYRDEEISTFFQKEVDAGIKNLYWWPPVQQ
jgi:ribonuclease Z